MSKKSLWLVALSAMLVLVSGSASDAASRQQSSRGKGTSQHKSMPNAFQTTQNQAKQVAQQQHNAWAAKRRAAAEAKANGSEATPVKKSSTDKPASAVK